MRLELPGLFDLQVNGFAGVDFNSRDVTADAVAQALERMRSTGVTRCLPTLITSPSRTSQPVRACWPEWPTRRSPDSIWKGPTSLRWMVLAARTPAST
jgi:hypothetical protein